ncbi:N-acetylmuramic acid 6-phosphate etherase [Luteibaculum oceani]|uniref:N-acetylmuramic acid 6-phosphate etherase n=1 Tax=Luteibaculum oceani TaxID=1294296 RepID=A0A5C6V0R6_9FLAO|nr:N-acetylmuramic acid 6-phosphate etherase [Luteibaculum oceani]TXC78534.1 N-acetylmuramic acid 6-phosphate etherase [Luteibaculum oceani]
MKKVTESDSLYNDIHQFSSIEIVSAMNQEDAKVAIAVEEAIPSIVSLIDAAFEKLKLGGRLFYIGAGTSGRLGVVDASECPPTFGVSPELVQGLIAGGDGAMRKAVEGAEDSPELAKTDLKGKSFSERDFLVGIAASGTTPYVIGGLNYAKDIGAGYGCITCNPGAPIISASANPIVVNCGPEFITGSTRLKAGTATKMVLNMISTALLVKLGHVQGNKMVDMQLSNEKLVDRGTRMVMAQLNISYDEAKTQLLKHGSVRKAVNAHKN